MVEPNPYGIVTFRLNNMAPLYKHILNGSRPWIKVSYTYFITDIVNVLIN